MNIGNAHQHKPVEYYDSVTNGLVKFGAVLGAFTFCGYEISAGVDDRYRNYIIPQSFGAAGIMVGATVGGACGWTAGKLYEGADILYISLRERICAAYEQYSQVKPSVTDQDSSPETMSALQPGATNEQNEDQSPIKTHQSRGGSGLLTGVRKDSSNTDGVKVCVGAEEATTATDVINGQSLTLKEGVEVKGQHECKHDDILPSISRLFESSDDIYSANYSAKPQKCSSDADIGVSFIEDKNRFKKGFSSIFSN